MKKVILSFLFLTILIFPNEIFADGGPYIGIPPTNAFDKIHSDNGTISAVNFSMPLTVKGGSGISVQSSNASHTLTITNTATPNTHNGSYNTTQANNVNINSGGYKINFINGTGATVHLQNSGSGNQVNVTVSATGVSSGVTSLNALTGALTIACVSGNTTCTTSGGNTITVNTAYNVVVTGGSAQTISKGITHSATVTMSGANIAMGTNQLTGNWTAKDSPIFGTGGNTYEYINSNNFNGYPTNSYVGAIGWNFQAAEIDFWNTYTPAGTSFAFRQLTGTNTQSTIFTIDKTSITSYVQNIWQPITDPTNHFTNSIWKSSTNADVLKYRNNANTTTYNILSTLGAVTTSTPADPSGTTSTTAKMMGLAGSITPAVSTRVDMSICGQMSNSVINDGATVQLRYGPGTAPTNGATLTGTQLGASQTFTALIAAQRDGFCVTGIATGLTIGTAYWMDVALNANTAGTATITGNTIKASER